jgi:hypothetical protein
MKSANPGQMLLPVLIGSAFFSNEGLQGAYFLGAVDLDVASTADGKLNWRVRCSLKLVRDLLRIIGKLTLISPYSRSTEPTIDICTGPTVKTYCTFSGKCARFRISPNDGR